MWERTLSQKSVRLFCEQKVIDEAKADAYVYGYELLISSVVSVLLVVLIAVVCGDVRYALSFLIGFIPQRIYIGGYHATSHTRCYLAFSGLALICILLSKAIAANHLFRILTTVALLGISIFLSPIEAKNKPLSEKKRSSYKMVASDTAYRRQRQMCIRDRHWRISRNVAHQMLSGVYRTGTYLHFAK